MIQYIDEITDAFLWELLESMPDYLILSGDLTFNGATESHNALISKLERLQEAGIQVLVIPGNHDVDSKYAVSFQGDSIENVGALSSAEFSKLYHSFGPEQAISQDTAAFSYSIQAAKDLRIILLDANSHGIGCLKDTTLQWLKRELKDAQDSGSRVITVSHQNLYAHNGMLSNVNPHRIRILTKTAL